jgi:phospholipase C
LRHHKKLLAGVPVALAAGAAVISLGSSSASPRALPAPTTPIKHVVVIFEENVSFDHYFGTYPYATNPKGEPPFHALPGTPSVNGLSAGLLTNNPNLDNPQRLDPRQALTCDQNHAYSSEQQADDGGLMDMYVQDTTGSGCTQSTTPDSSSYGPPGIVMDYYDGNTVTAEWNLAQHFALSDNFYDTQFGPSTPGAINLVSGDTAGAVVHGGTSSSVAPNGTMFGDTEPYYDQCSNNTTAINADGTPGGVTVSMTGKNIGDLMNSAGVTWGWFQGGFTPGATVPAGTGTDVLQDAGASTNYAEGPVARPACNTSHENIGDAEVQDYVEHHEPFEYYADTSNPDHVSPASVSDVGYSDPAGTPADEAVNHQYDMSWFYQALDHGNLPQVSFLKPPAYQNGHAGYSDPLDEERFLVGAIDRIEKSSYWSSTAIIITYDDSDGWYDHVLGPIVRPSEDTNDELDGPGKCGSSATPPATNDRCGVGPRLPLLVISPYARQNYVDNTFTEQASITQFIEDNWNLGRIGSGSADATAGSIDGMFDFSPHASRAPAILMNASNGEIEKTIAARGSGASGGPSSFGARRGARDTYHYKCAISGPSSRLVVKCGTAAGTSKSVTKELTKDSIEILLHHNGRLVASAKGRLGKKIKIHARLHGKYTLAVDAAGQVNVVRSIRIA